MKKLTPIFENHPSTGLLHISHIVNAHVSEYESVGSAYSATIVEHFFLVCLSLSIVIVMFKAATTELIRIIYQITYVQEKSHELPIVEQFHCTAPVCFH